MWIITKNHGEEDEAFWDGEKWNQGPFARAAIYIDEPIYVPEGGVVMRGFFNTKERDAHNSSIEGRTERAIDLIEGLPKGKAAEVTNAGLKRLGFESANRTQLRRIAGKEDDNR
jgi:hypothetical protein